MENKRIVIYADPASRTSVSSLREEFRRALGSQTEIVEVTAQDVLAGKALDENTLAFVLPGIVGEDSLYHAHLGEKGNNLIRAYVQKGGTFIGLCAGAYYAASKIEYRPTWSRAKGRSEGILKLFNGVARGPVAGFGTARHLPINADSCGATPVILADGTKAEMAYSAGPAFYNIPAGAAVLAYYDTPEKPVAAFTAAVGKGRIVLSGILLQYGVPPGWTKPARPGATDKLIGQLQPHEPARSRLWDQIMSFIQ